MNEMNYGYASSGQRWRVAFYRLTAVRLIMFMARLLGRGLLFIARLGLQLVKIIGLWTIDRLYALKSTAIDMTYAGRKEKVRLRSALTVVSDIKLVVSQSLPHAARGVKDEVRRSFPKTAAPRSLAWSMVNFILVLLVIVSPIVIYAHWRSLDKVKSGVLQSVSAAFSDLFSARDLLGQKNLPEARDAFGRAGENFLTARQELSSINQILFEVAALIPNQQFKLAASSKHLLAAGELSARLGKNLSQALVLPEGQKPTAEHYLANFLQQAEPSLEDAKALEKELKKIDAEALPEEYRTQFSELSGKASFLRASLSEAIDLANQLSVFLGQQMDKRYMLVFQNNSERRASGGFIGSFAIVDLRRGEVMKLTVPKGGSYDTEAGLSKLVAAPEPLQLLNARWHFWDANWWPDWPTSAKKLQWFYENSNGPSVDGVISLTPTVIERLLAAIGPVDMTKDYGVIITAENFWTVTQTFSEQKPHVTTEPKKIIGDLMNKIIEELPQRLNPDLTMKLIALLEESLNEKQMLAYFNDKDLQASAERFGWSGKTAETDGDYLMVVDTNIGGQKSDRVISETLDHQAKILPDGSIIDTLTIRREHKGVKNEVFTGVRNVDWLRVYVPKGSTLISASGFRSPGPALFDEPENGAEIDPELKEENAARIDPNSGTRYYEEADKTVFANWSMVDPGETAIIQFTYKLPFTISEQKPRNWQERFQEFIHGAPSQRYSLLVQKQPGAERVFLNSEVRFEKPIQLRWQYPENLQADILGWKAARELSSDYFAAVLFEL